MRTVYKYPLRHVSIQDVFLQAGAKLLCVKEQQGVLCLWAEVDTRAPQATIEVAIFGTGHEMPKDANLHHIDSVMLAGGALVFHVYEVRHE